jgi:hypothetical protein
MLKILSASKKFVNGVYTFTAKDSTGKEETRSTRVYLDIALERAYFDMMPEKFSPPVVELCKILTGSCGPKFVKYSDDTKRDYWKSESGSAWRLYVWKEEAAKVNP